MAEDAVDTRTEIIEAARKEFLSHGYEGARLQKIADNIGVTKAMIHYYFNTKKELFERVYGQSVRQVFGELDEVLNKNIPLFKKIEELIECCLDVAQTEPQVLTFVVTESSRKPDWLAPVLQEHTVMNIQNFENELKEAASNYKIAAVDAQTLIMQIFSLCYYPVISNTISTALFEGQSTTNGSSTSPKGIILDTILNWLTA